MCVQIVCYCYYYLFFLFYSKKKKKNICIINNNNNSVVKGLYLIYCFLVLFLRRIVNHII